MKRLKGIVGRGLPFNGRVVLVPLVLLAIGFSISHRVRPTKEAAVVSSHHNLPFCRLEEQLGMIANTFKHQVRDVTRFD